MRLFFALWPDQGLQHAMGDWVRSAHCVCGGRKIPDEKLHVTLAFLGEVEAARYSSLVDIGSAVSAATFELSFDRIAYWRHNRIVYAAANGIPAALATLAGALTERLGGAGLPIDRRTFMPHVTLLRDAKRAPPQAETGPLVWRVGALSLVETIRRQGKHAYQVRESWTLAR